MDFLIQLGFSAALLFPFSQTRLFTLSPIPVSFSVDQPVKEIKRFPIQPPPGYTLSQTQESEIQTEKTNASPETNYVDVMPIDYSPSPIPALSPHNTPETLPGAPGQTAPSGPGESHSSPPTQSDEDVVESSPSTVLPKEKPTEANTMYTPSN